MSSLLKKFGDHQVGIAERASMDEYQEEIYHKSSTVGSIANMYGLFLMGAILAWTLPGAYGFYSFLTLIPALFTVIASYGWMKHYAPRPKANLEMKSTWPAYLLLIIQMIGVNVNRDAGIGAAQVALGIGPALVGGIIGVGITMAVMKSMRSKDENRFDKAADMEEENF